MHPALQGEHCGVVDPQSQETGRQREPDHPVLPWVRTERCTIRDTSNHHQGRGHGGHCLGHRIRADP